MALGACIPLVAIGCLSMLDSMHTFPLLFVRARLVGWLNALGARGLAVAENSLELIRQSPLLGCNHVLLIKKVNPKVEQSATFHCLIGLILHKTTRVTKIISYLSIKLLSLLTPNCI